MNIRGVTMTAIKKENQEASLSINDLRLKKFLELQAEIKDLTKKLNSIKDEIKHTGSHATRAYIATVTTSERTSAPALKVLIEAFGEANVMPLTKTSQVVNIKVAKKGGN